MRTAPWFINAALILFFSLISVAQAQFAGGSGTVDDPYLVATAEHLNNVRNHLDQHFRQTANIDLGVAPWNTEQGWAPIGASASGSRFTGRFDGGGYAIRNLSIDRSGQDYQGLFGYLEGAVIRNMKLENVNIKGRQYTGALAGWATGAAVENVRAGGAIGGTIQTGGLIGYLGGGRLHDVSVDATVQGTQYTGGLVGETVWVSAFGNPTLRHAHVRGSVIGTREVGGLIGRYSTQTDTADSYSHASVSGESSVGGFVGYMYAGGSGKIIRSYSTGPVTGTGDHVGGFIGQYHDGVTADCLWDMQTSGQATSAGGVGVTGKTTAAMRQQATFAGFNFLTLWTIHEGQGYPFLQNLAAYPRPRDVNLGDLAGEGTVENPYIITSASELNAIRQNPAAHYRLGAAIDMSATVAWNYGLGWAPVGTYSPSSPFTGSVDGQSHAVSNLTVNRSAHDYQGFFGFMENAVVHNFMLTDTQISGRNYTGGLAGYANSCGMQNIRVSGTVSGGQRTGGLVGLLANFSWLHDSSSDVSVNGQYGTGGLVGETSASVAGGSGVRPTIRHSSARGMVRGTDRVGGLVGALHSGFIADNYSHGAVTGNDKVGGLVGYTYHGVYRCYSVGPVVGTSEDVGGLIGRWDNAAGSDTAQGTVLFSYWDTETSGQPASSAGEGKTTEQMQQQATYDSFNFFTAWQINEGGGYPGFQDMSGYHPPLDVNLADLEGTGTEEDPYRITTASELNAVRQDLAAHYRLGNDIDLSATVAWNYGAGWMPLGNNTNSFTGSLDGHGHTLRNLTVNRPKSDYQGLLGYQWNAPVRDLSLLDVNVLGRSTVGGLAGLIHGGTSENIVVTGQVIGTSNTVGGVAGSSGSSGSEIVQNALAVVRVWGTYNVGGLVGYNGGIIRRSYTRGDVRGTTRVGGLAGYMSHSWAKIENAYSQAAVHGTDSVGGLLGQINFSGTIDNAYSSGPVVGTEEGVGGLVGGRFDTSSLVRSSYWDTQASGQSQSAGGAGVIGRTTAQMTHPHGDTTYVGWDFLTTWDEDSIPRNHGYPYLAGVTPPPLNIVLQAGSDQGGTVSGGNDYVFGSMVTTKATPHAGWRFLHWTENGQIVSTSPSYTFSAAANRDLTAQFAPLEVTYLLTVNTTGTGTGRVTSNPPGIDCGNLCAHAFVENTPVTLTAQPDTNAIFGGWSGACSGSGSCMPSMTQARTVTATFILDDGDCVDHVQLNNINVNDTRSYKACRTLTVTGFVAQSPANVVFRAGERITLGAGFQVHPGARFTAQIDSSLRPAASRAATPFSHRTLTAPAPAPAPLWPSSRALTWSDLPESLTTWLTDHNASIQDAQASADGQFIVFATDAALLAEDDNAHGDVYGYDSTTGQLSLISRTADGRAGDAASHSPRLNAAGDRALYLSRASELVSGPSNGYQHVYRYDPLFEQTMRLSTTATGAPASGDSDQLLIAGDWAIYRTEAEDIGPEGAGIYRDHLDEPHQSLIGRDLWQRPDPRASQPTASADGTLLAYQRPNASERTQIHLSDLFRIDAIGQTEASQHGLPTLSADGRYLAYRERTDAGTLWLRVVDRLEDREALLPWPDPAMEQAAQFRLDGAELWWINPSQGLDHPEVRYRLGNPLRQ